MRENIFLCVSFFITQDSRVCIDLHIPRDAADGYFSGADRTDRASVIGFYEKLPVVVYPDRSAGKGFLWIKYMTALPLFTRPFS